MARPTDVIGPDRSGAPERGSNRSPTRDKLREVLQIPRELASRWQRRIGADRRRCPPCLTRGAVGLASAFCGDHRCRAEAVERSEHELFMRAAGAAGDTWVAIGGLEMPRQAASAARQRWSSNDGWRGTLITRAQPAGRKADVEPNRAGYPSTSVHSACPRDSGRPTDRRGALGGHWIADAMSSNTCWSRSRTRSTIPIAQRPTSPLHRAQASTIRQSVDPHQRPRQHVIDGIVRPEGAYRSRNNAVQRRP